MFQETWAVRIELKFGGVTVNVRLGVDTAEIAAVGVTGVVVNSCVEVGTDVTVVTIDVVKATTEVDDLTDCIQAVSNKIATSK